MAAPAVMHTLPRVRTGLAVQGRIHALLRAFPADPPAAAPRFANYVAADGLAEAVAAGTRRIRAWRPAPAEARLADLADQLAATLTRREQRDPVENRRRGPRRAQHRRQPTGDDRHGPLASSIDRAIRLSTAAPC